MLRPTSESEPAKTKQFRADSLQIVEQGLK